jgi:hypothetical protein
MHTAFWYGKVRKWQLRRPKRKIIIILGKLVVRMGSCSVVGFSVSSAGSLELFYSGTHYHHSGKRPCKLK